MLPFGQRGAFGRIYLAVVAVVTGALGAVLGAGGVWLFALGGSWYYAVAGTGLVVCAGLLMRHRMAGVWLYVAIFAATVVWALWERGLNGWAQVPRLLGPAILLVAILLAVPVLRRGARHAGRLVAVAVVGLGAGGSCGGSADADGCADGAGHGGRRCGSG